MTIRRTCLIIFFLVIIMLLNGCSSTSKQIDGFQGLSIPKSPIMALELNGSNINYNKIQNNRILKVGSSSDIWNMVYNTNANVTAYTKILSKGKELDNVEIYVEKDDNAYLLDNFYNADNLKLSPDGNMLAYRTFSKDSVESAQGIKVYDINHNKEMGISKDSLVSGTLYEWLDGDNLLYYAVKDGKADSDKIYKYNFTSKKEEVYLDKTTGYCTFFTVEKGNILFFSKLGDDTNLSYYYKSTGKVKSLDNNFSDIYDSVYNAVTKEFFILAKDKYGVLGLFRINVENNTCKRVNYDFPKVINKDGGVSADNNGNVYFSGTSDSSDNPQYDIYMYNINDNSINLLSSHPSNYIVISSK